MKFPSDKNKQGFYCDNDVMKRFKANCVINEVAYSKQLEKLIKEYNKKEGDKYERAKTNSHKSTKGIINKVEHPQLR